jgi:hypothetical protein
MVMCFIARRPLFNINRRTAISEVKRPLRNRSGSERLQIYSGYEYM